PCTNTDLGETSRCDASENRVDGACAVTAHHGKHEGGAEFDAIEGTHLRFDQPQFFVRELAQDSFVKVPLVYGIKTIPQRFHDAPADIPVQVDQAGQDRLV